MESELEESLSTGQVVIIGSADAALKPSPIKKSQINLMKPFGHAGSLLAIGLLILQTFKSKCTNLFPVEVFLCILTSCICIALRISLKSPSAVDFRVSQMNRMFQQHGVPGNNNLSFIILSC